VLISSALFSQTLNLFTDCQFCDKDYFREKVSYVNHVRDREDADVHMLVTSQTTGSGGSEYNMIFYGLKANEGRSDTITFNTEETATSDVIRKKMVKYLHVGLLPYMKNDPMMERFMISFEPIKKEKMVTPVDKWNKWVFRTSLSGNFNGQKTYESQRLSGSFGASRVTENWKIRMSMRMSENKDSFDYGDLKYKSTQDSKKISGSVIKSLGKHFSTGFWGSLSSSSYSNLDRSIVITPKVEYNLFPYSESNHRQIRVEYGIGYNDRNYVKETIYFKMKEQLWQQSARVSASFVQPWGSADVNINGSSYLHDGSKNQVSLFTSLNLRILKGLSVNFYGSFSRIRDQLNLANEDLPDEDVLLRRKELATQFSYYSGISLSYTFGSKFNNVVNPRFGGSGGGGRIIIM